jgi:hypothetical protein
MPTACGVWFQINMLGKRNIFFAEDSGLLECDAKQLGRHIPMFWGNLLHPSSGYLAVTFKYTVCINKEFYLTHLIRFLHNLATDL